MNRRTLLPLVLSPLATLLGVEPRQDVVAAPASSPLVGTWRITVQGAPVAHNMLVFHGDGTILSLQSSGAYPTSISDGAGAYQQLTPHRAEGAFEELNYDIISRAYLGYIRVEFRVAMVNTQLRGDAVTRVFDAQGNIIMIAYPSWIGNRVSSTVHFPH